ncbi:adenylate kinase 2, chloroplastic [Brassica rapa]|uniref:adenylate kinase 2, chloroplastic n=1 Tax=Brassica campestris TaxID=3711 RepID=UPI0004F1666C|nr:adenylate kinase 2, chloroplastic [Brassica rapa]XP_033136580.1 adenylate kinase 2, chloroplastic [Brassica rapa]
MACCVNYISPPRASLSPPPSRSSFSGDALHSLLREPTLLLRRHSRSPSIVAPRFQVVAAEKAEPPLKIMISGAPASGKGTQCELITQKYGLVHISAGDLLRAEIASGSGNGKLAKEYMEKGQLVPDEIVVMMVKDRLSQTDSQQKGWLLDGYPRSSSQATALKGFGFQPDLFIVLEVPEDILLERVVGRRLDPVTGKIYHLKYSPPETEEIAARLTQRFDDTEEKAKLRLKTHNQNVSDVLSMYDDITIKIKGNRSKEEVFAQIDTALSQMLQQRNNTSPSSLSS